MMLKELFELSGFTYNFIYGLLSLFNITYLKICFFKKNYFFHHAKDLWYQMSLSIRILRSSYVRLMVMESEDLVNC